MAMESRVQPTKPESLLDAADFLAELEGLEDGLTNGRGSPRPVTPVVDDVAGDESTMVGRIALAALFVLMMGVGAAGAAAVFHERVARILASW